jgi:hypothetical protein
MKVVVSRLLLVTSVLAFTGLIPSRTEAFGGDFWWGNNGYVIGVGNTSNIVGFWQALLASNNYICNTQDGIFGPATRSATQGFQSDVAGVTPDGIVGSQTWGATQAAEDGVFGPRLTGGGPYFNYYGGGAISAELYWLGDGYEWLFNRTGSGGLWNAAVPWSNGDPYDHC